MSKLSRRNAVLAIPALGFAGVIASAAAASTFLRVPLGRGASIEVPRNWVALSGNQRMTLESLIEAKGARLTEANLGFAANLMGEDGKTLATVNALFYPENPITQEQARSIGPADIAAIGEQIKTPTEAPLKSRGIRVTNWYPARVQIINGLHVFVHEHQHSGAGDLGLTRVRGLRVWASPRSFTVTLSYRERESEVLLPIVDRIASSIRLDSDSKG